MEHDKASEGRRQHARYPLSQTVTFEVSAPLTVQESPQEETEGNTQNVSEGGLCLSTERALEESQIVKIKLPIPNVVATTPTLAEVRWVKRPPIHRLPEPDLTAGRQQPAARHVLSKQNGEQYLVGLRFLF